MWFPTTARKEKEKEKSNTSYDFKKTIPSHVTTKDVLKEKEKELAFRIWEKGERSEIFLNA